MSGEPFDAIFFATSCIAGVISIFLLLDANASRVLGWNGTGWNAFLSHHPLLR
jgi:hypothetical protein